MKSKIDQEIRDIISKKIEEEVEELKRNSNTREAVEVVRIAHNVLPIMVKSEVKRKWWRFGFGFKKTAELCATNSIEIGAAAVRAFRELIQKSIPEPECDCEDCRKARGETNDSGND